MKARHKDTGEIIELAEEGILSSDGRRFCWYQVELLPEPIDEVQPSLPSNLDEAEFNYVKSLENAPADQGEELMICEAFKAGAEWMAGQGWIDDGSMPPETKQESDTLQGHREWTESKPVLAWDSMYGCRVDWTSNGKWMSEQTGGYTGQLCHGIIAWRPIPKYKEKQ